MRHKLLYDLTAAQTNDRDKYGGGSVYASIVFHKAVEAGWIDFECVYNPDLFLNQKIRDECTSNNIKLHEVKTSNDIKNLVAKVGYEKFYSAMPYNYSDFDFEQTKFILTIHGLRYLEMPSDKTEMFYYPGVLRKIKFLLNGYFKSKQRYTIHKAKFDSLMALKNKRLIAVSEHTKYSLLTYFPELKDDVVVCHSPIDFTVFYEPNANKKNYFLLISANRWIKNNYRAIKAFDDLFSRGLIKDKEVVVLGVGRLNFSKSVVNKERFHFFDYVDYATLENHFNDAFCFVYPSLNEGFGYPPIQAIKYGTPVIASAISSIPEVCQNAVCYFNPFSIEELQNRVMQISSDRNYCNILIKQGFLRLEELKVKQENMFEQLIEIIFS